MISGPRASALATESQEHTSKVCVWQTTTTTTYQQCLYMGKNNYVVPTQHISQYDQRKQPTQLSAALANNNNNKVPLHLHPRVEKKKDLTNIC